MNSQVLRAYLDEVLGEAPALSPAAPDKVGGIPIYLLSLYELFEVKLFGRGLVFAVAVDREDPATPAEYAGQVNLLQTAVHTPVVLVLPDIRPFERLRLVKLGVPFVVPGRQLFLPHLMIDLREHFPRGNPRPRGSLSAAAQASVIYHLQRHPLTGLPLREVAHRLGYCAMTMSKVARELSVAGLCGFGGTGRVRTLAFAAAGKALWEQALPLLRSPVRTRQATRWQLPQASIRAGISALAACSDLNDDPIPTYAMRDGAFAQLRGHGALTVAEARDEADAMIELWNYAPELLAADERVDPLSLFLSLQGTPDERVDGALRDLLGAVQW